MDTPVRNPTTYKPSLSSSRKAVLDKDSDRTLRRSIHNLFSAGSMLEELRGIMGEPIGLTGVQYQILMVIARHARTLPLRVEKVADQLEEKADKSQLKKLADKRA